MTIEKKIDDLLNGDFHFLEGKFHKLIWEDEEIAEYRKYFDWNLAQSDVLCLVSTEYFKKQVAEYQCLVRDKIRPHAEQSIKEFNQAWDEAHEKINT